MSLYNMVNGVNAAAFFILPALGKHPNEYPRFRDAFYGCTDRPEYDDHIIVMTRVGGGNRDDYDNEIDELKEMDTYVTDFDESFDPTYASFVFAVPDEWKADVQLIAEGNVAKISDAYLEQMCKVFPTLADKFREACGRSDAIKPDIAS